MPSSIIKDPKLAPEGCLKIRWVEQHAPVLKAIHDLPAEIDREIASIKLETLGVGIDRLTADQEEHRRRWQ